MRLRNRIAVNFTIVTLALLSIVFGVIYYFTYRYTENEFLSRLEERATIAAKAFLEQDELGQKLLDQVRSLHLRTLPGEQEFFVRLDTSQYDPFGLPPFIGEDFIHKVNKNGYAELKYENRLGVGIRYVDNQGVYAATVTAIDRYGQRKLNNLRKLMGVTLIIYLAIVFLIGRWYALHSLHPLSLMISKMQEINSSNLHLRLEESVDNKDEISQLARTFNSMLDRIETSIEAQNNFIGNASHQLKNPLTAILGEVETTLLSDRSPEEYRRSLVSIGEEGDRLRALIVRLLRLAHTSAEEDAEAITEWRLDELLLELAEEYRELIAGAALRIDFASFPEDSELLTFKGNRNLIRIALSNIIENAFKFSDQQDVLLSLRVSDEKKEILISDQGVGIPPEEQERIFDPFYRAPNVRHFPGYGIGLPLVKKIIKMHYGEISVRSAPGQGAVFRISLPG